MKKSQRAWWIMAPYLVWGATLLVFPLLIVLTLSFQSRGDYGEIVWSWSLQNYKNLSEAFFLGSFFRGIFLALFVSFICVAWALPMAWAMASFSPRVKSFIVIFVCVPFFANLIARIYAIKAFLNPQGPLQWAIGTSYFNLDQNFWVMIYGFVTTFLPLALFPIWMALEKLGPQLFWAASDLGASPWQAFVRVYLSPLSGPMATGFVLVFIPTLGEFLIPDLLGGAQHYLLAHQLSGQFLKVRDWPMGAALTIALLIILISLTWFILRLGEKRYQQ